MTENPQTADKKMNYEIMEDNVSEHEKEDNGMVTIGEALVNRGIEYGIEQGIQALILDNRDRGESEEILS